MLLYHLPLTSNSATPNLTNKGLRNDYIIGGQGQFVSGGRLSSYCWNNQRNKIQFNIDSSGHYTVCFRYKNYAEQNNWSNVFSMIGSGSNTVSLLMNNWYAMYIDINASQSIYMSYNYNDNKWHDILVVYINGKGKIYVDNIEKATFSASLNVVAIGGRANQPSGFSQNFDCQFQDIRIYSHILTTQEIADYSKALVLHYPLNGSVKDCSGLGYNGITANTLQYDSNTPRNSKSLYCGGNVDIDTELSQKCLENAFTISACVKADEISNYRGVLGYHNSRLTDTSSWLMGGICYAQCVNNYIVFSIYGQTGNEIAIIRHSAVVNTIYNYVFVYKKNVGIYLYINGVLFDKIEGNSVAMYGNEQLPIHIGRAFSATNRYWKGNISDLRIYASALSQADIQALYKTPITLGNSLNAYELKEQPKYKSKAWRTPTYNEMNYILNQRPNALNLRGLGRVQVGSTYVNGCFLLPDNFVLPSGINFTPTIADYATNSYTLEQFTSLENVGIFFIACNGWRNGTTYINDGVTNSRGFMWEAGAHSLSFFVNAVSDTVRTNQQYRGFSVRLVQTNENGKFATPYGTIDFASGNLQYHCTQRKWRFAPNQYDYIGQANSNISDTYNGWIDLFGYGTSGVNYSPTLHTTNNSDYASGNIANTDNDWGINQITTAEYEEQNIKLYKSGVIKANEISESTSNQFSKNGILTTELKEI